MSRSLTKGVVVLLALPALLLPAAALVYILYRGLPVLSWQFVSSSEPLAGFGRAQGILPQISGSLLLAGLAALVAVPIALGAALYHQLFASACQRRWLDGLLNMLQGIPPVVFGLFGLVVLVYLFDWGVSLASGAVVLALVILPMLVLSAITGLAAIELAQIEAAYALGLSRWALIRRVWLPQAWRPLLTGLLLALARALSETAPILFTATVFSGIVWPASIFEPVTSLQTHIFYLAQEGGGAEVVEVVWGSALVLIGLVAGLSLLARILSGLGAVR